MPDVLRTAASVTPDGRVTGSTWSMSDQAARMTKLPASYWRPRSSTRSLGSWRWRRPNMRNPVCTTTYAMAIGQLIVATRIAATGRAASRKRASIFSVRERSLARDGVRTRPTHRC